MQCCLNLSMAKFEVLTDRNPEDMYKYCFENLTKETTDSSCIHNLRTFFLIKDIDRKRETTYLVT
jgi:hypothetical protein